MRYAEFLILAFIAIWSANALSIQNLNFESDSSLRFTALEKRKGGGGGGGGRSGGGTSSGGTSSGGTSGGSGTHTSGTGTSTGGGTTGGGTRSVGATTPRSYGGGSSYAGGSTVGYSAGQRSPAGLTPYFLGGAALGFFPGLWLYGAYAYPYNHRVPLHNNTSNSNTTYPVLCLCEQYDPCGCDDNTNTTYVDSLTSDGTVQGLDTNVAKLTNINGTETLVINGTLSNGTDGTSAAFTFKQNPLAPLGYWFTFAVVLVSIFGLL